MALRYGYSPDFAGAQVALSANSGLLTIGPGVGPFNLPDRVDLDAITGLLGPVADLDGTNYAPLLPSPKYAAGVNPVSTLSEVRGGDARTIRANVPAGTINSVRFYADCGGSGQGDAAAKAILRDSAGNLLGTSNTVSAYRNRLKTPTAEPGDQSSIVACNAGVIAFDSSVSHSGTTSVKVFSPVGGNQGVNYNGINDGSHPYPSGTVLTGSVWVLGDGVSTVNVYLSGRYGNDQYAGDQGYNTGDTYTPPAGVWTKYTATMTVTTNYIYGVALGVVGGGSGIANFWTDDAMVTVGSAATTESFYANKPAARWYTVTLPTPIVWPGGDMYIGVQPLSDTFAFQAQGPSTPTEQYSDNFDSYGTFVMPSGYSFNGTGVAGSTVVGATTTPATSDTTNYSVGGGMDSASDITKWTVYPGGAGTFTFDATGDSDSTGGGRFQGSFSATGSVEVYPNVSSTTTTAPVVPYASYNISSVVRLNAAMTGYTVAFQPVFRIYNSAGSFLGNMRPTQVTPSVGTWATLVHSVSSAAVTSAFPTAAYVNGSTIANYTGSGTATLDFDIGHVVTSTYTDYAKTSTQSFRLALTNNSVADPLIYQSGVAANPGDIVTVNAWYYKREATALNCTIGMFNGDVNEAGTQADIPQGVWTKKTLTKTWYGPSTTIGVYFRFGAGQNRTLYIDNVSIQVQRKDNARTSSFRVASAPAPAIYKNEMTNPSGSVNTANWGGYTPSGSITVARDATKGYLFPLSAASLSFSGTTGAGGPWSLSPQYASNLIPVTPGQAVDVAMAAMPVTGITSFSYWLSFIDQEGQLLNFTTFFSPSSVNTNVWGTASYKTVAPAGAKSVFLGLGLGVPSSTAWQANIGHAQIVLGAPSTAVVPMIHGDFPGFVWDDTGVGQTTSRGPIGRVNHMRNPGLRLNSGYSGNQTSAQIYADSTAPSGFAVKATGNTGTDPFISPPYVTDISRPAWPAAPGETWTLSGLWKVNSTMLAQLNANPGLSYRAGPSMWYRDANLNYLAFGVSSAQWPKVADQWTEFSMQLTAPNPFYAMFIRLYNGALIDGSETSYTRLKIERTTSAADPGYFDRLTNIPNNSSNEEITGAADASETVQAVPFDMSPLTGRTTWNVGTQPGIKTGTNAGIQVSYS